MLIFLLLHAGNNYFSVFASVKLLEFDNQGKTFANSQTRHILFSVNISVDNLSLFGEKGFKLFDFDDERKVVGAQLMYVICNVFFYLLFFFFIFFSEGECENMKYIPYNGR